MVSYFGAEHSNDPKHPQYEALKAQFEKAKPNKVFVEGMLGLQRNKEEEIQRLKTIGYEDAIKEYGENGFAAKLAIETGVDVESPEPDAATVITQVLEQGFSRDEIFAYYFYLMIPQYQRMRTAGFKQAFHQFIKPYIREFQHATQWEGFDYSFEHALDIGREIFPGKDFDAEDSFYDDSRIGPLGGEDSTVINKITQEVNYQKDIHIVHSIADSVQNGNRVFVVYGETHAVMQEPALRKIIKS